MKIQAIREAFKAEGKRLSPELEEYELRHIIGRFHKYRKCMEDRDAFMNALKDIPDLQRRSEKWSLEKHAHIQG